MLTPQVKLIDLQNISANYKVWITEHISVFLQCRYATKYWIALSRSHYAHLTPVPICPYYIACWGKHVTNKPPSGEKKRLIKQALRGEERLMGTFAAHVDVLYISTYISINLGPSLYRSLFTWTGVDLFWRTSARNGVYMGSHIRTVSFSVQVISMRLFEEDLSKTGGPS